jgi:hypothetical protein
VLLLLLLVLLMLLLLLLLLLLVQLLVLLLQQRAHRPFAGGGRSHFLWRVRVPLAAALLLLLCYVPRPLKSCQPYVIRT